MKKILLLIALAGFTATGGYAQNKHVPEARTMVIHKKAGKVVPTCFALKKENFGIPGCVDMNYSSSNAYFGNYTHKATVATKIPRIRRAPMAPLPAAPLERPFFKRVDDQFIPCQTYAHNGITVKTCDAEFYDNEKEPLLYAPMPMISNASMYMGYYPVDDETKAIKDPSKPENWTDGQKHYPKDDQNFLGEYKNQ